jgi:AcrR family transcriptional regulator
LTSEYQWYLISLVAARRRLSRDAQVERNRGLLLAAARRVFLARGFHGASLDAIAEEAGFSKGVVYSQFDSKADLFLALLEERIAERAAENARVASGAGSPAATIAALFALGERRGRSEAAWNLLLIEFRAEAARDPELNERYAKLHARTAERLGALLSGVLAEAGVEPPAPPSVLASFVLALSIGTRLENFATPGSLPHDALARLVSRALGVKPEDS